MCRHFGLFFYLVLLIGRVSSSFSDRSTRLLLYNHWVLHVVFIETASTRLARRRRVASLADVLMLEVKHLVKFPPFNDGPVFYVLSLSFLSFSLLFTAAAAASVLRSVQ